VAHVITQACCNDASCVEVCPADCIHPTPNELEYPQTEMLYIDPLLCVDCGACIEACPVAAILPDDELTPSMREYAALNALYFEQGLGRHDRRDPMSPVPRRMGLVLTNANGSGSPAGNPTLRVAIVGSGPSAAYAADELFRHEPGVAVTMFERLPTPWGLVRAGVAPDHPETKEVTSLFERTACRQNFTFHLNVEVGKDVTHEEVLASHDAVIYAVGAPSARRLDVPGEDLPGSHSATDFVAWYNGHPEAATRAFDLSSKRAVIVGNGNVALDIARILVSDVRDLARTDIADHALDALAKSAIEEVVILGRRGPAQAAYTTPELMALGKLPRADLVADAAETSLDPVTVAWLRDHPDPIASLKASLARQAATAARRHPRRIHLRFLRSPVEVLGDDRVRGLRIVRNELTLSPTGRLQAVPTDETEDLVCGLVLRSVGYQAHPVTGVPFDNETSTLPHREGRVIEPESGEVLPGVYTAGWIKRGPSGVIGTNKFCASETVSALLADHAAGSLQSPATDQDSLAALILQRRPEALAYKDWEAIDRHERALGAQAGRPRVKLVDVENMLAAAVARSSPSGPASDAEALVADGVWL
jgi:ferredoxin--NADP+ reductase